MARGAVLFWAIGACLAGAWDAAAQNSAGPGDAAWDRLYSQGGLPWYDGQGDHWRAVRLPLDGGNPDSLLRHRHSSWQPPAVTPQSQIGARSPIFKWISSWMAGQTVWSFIGAVLLAVAIAGLLWWAYRRGSRFAWRTGQEAENRATPSSQTSLLPAVTMATEVDLWTTAHQRYATGDLPAALAYLYCYLLTALQRRGLLEFVPGKTSRDYVGDLRSRPTIAQRFALVADRYERAFFGRENLPQNAVRECFENAKRIVEDSIPDDSKLEMLS